MKNTQAKKMRERLIKACDKHLKNGGTIASGCFSDGDNSFCPITCLIGDIKDVPTEELSLKVSKKLGFKVGEFEIWDFIFNFDGSLAVADSTTNLPAKMGQALRKKYLKL